VRARSGNRWILHGNVPMGEFRSLSRGSWIASLPANSLFANDGQRGGLVGVAPVPADRLPEPLPLGLEASLVITVQTDGPENFYAPVSVRFPNLPDPLTGVRLAPGEKAALWSFNHDTGHWEIQGPMTVSEDGEFVESDPGFGIRQPGWHMAALGVALHRVGLARACGCRPSRCGF
jgi:hypothetical protein